MAVKKLNRLVTNVEKIQLIVTVVTVVFDKIWWHGEQLHNRRQALDCSAHHWRTKTLYREQSYRTKCVSNLSFEHSLFTVPSHSFIFQKSLFQVPAQMVKRPLLRQGIRGSNPFHASRVTTNLCSFFIQLYLLFTSEQHDIKQNRPT